MLTTVTGKGISMNHIEGLKIRMASEELKNHLMERSAYHRDKAVQKEKELPALKDALEKLKTSGIAPESLARMSGKSGTYQLSPEETIKDLENDIRDHYNKSLVFEFFANHLFDQPYVLQENDLIRMEVLKRW